MKTTVLTALTFLLLTFTSNAQNAMQKASDKVCNCLNQITDTADIKKYKAAAMDCFTTSALTEIVQIAEERKVDFTDQTAMRNIGIELGKKLLKDNCKGYIAYARITSRDADEEHDNTVAEKSSSGKVLRIDNRDFVYVVLKDKQGREQNFIWLEYFSGSEKLTGNKIQSLVNKDVTVKWIEKEVYLPKAGDYFKIKQITALSE